MAVDQGPCLALNRSASLSVPSPLISSEPSKNSWYTSRGTVDTITATVNTRRFSSSVIPHTSTHTSSPSPKMRSSALYSDGMNDTSSSNTSRTKGFNLSRVFASKKVKDTHGAAKSNKNDTASVGSPQSASLVQQRLPSFPLIVAPCAEIAVEPVEASLPQVAPALRRREDPRLPHDMTSNVTSSQVPTQNSQTRYYRHRVTEAYQPSQRFAAAIAVGFSPAQATAILSLPPVAPSAPPTKYGIPRLPRGTLSPDKLVHLDWALAIIAAERNQAEVEAQKYRKHSSRGRNRGQEPESPSQSAVSGVVTVAEGAKVSPQADQPSSCPGFEDVEVLEATEQAGWETASERSGALQLSGTGLGSTVSRSSSASSYSSFISANKSAVGAYESSKKPSTSQSESEHSVLSSGTSRHQGRMLMDLAWDEGITSASGSENTNETEILLDDKDVQALKCPNKGGKASLEGGHVDIVGSGRRRSSVMSGTLGLLASPVTQTVGMLPLSAASTRYTAVDTSDGGGQYSEALTEECGPTLAPPTTNGSASSSSDTKFFRRPSWSLPVRKSSINAHRQPNGESTVTYDSRNVESHIVDSDASAARRPRARLLSFSGTKNRLGLALGIPSVRA